jgi:DNA-binding transcriptional MerR regulator/methylmalonyl-CoA mutase cobalamin-binding subunit
VALLGKSGKLLSMTTMRETRAAVQQVRRVDPVAEPTLPIAAVERDTGLSKDTLRMWERRYGFPSPQRDAQGERAYPMAQVERLRLIRRLIDAGHRPSRVMALDGPAVEALLDKARRTEAAGAAAATVGQRRLPEILAALQRFDLQALRLDLQGDLARLGLERFVRDLLAPACTGVGEAWLHGEIAVHQEHAFTEIVERLLHQALLTLPPVPASAGPRVLLTTLPGEPHGLGLLMAEAQLVLEGAVCIPLGLQTPLPEIVAAAAAHRVDIVALGLSGCSPERSLVATLQRLRQALPRSVALWAGGRAPALRRRRLVGINVVTELHDVPAALQAWRNHRPAPAADDRADARAVLVHRAP